MQILDYVVLLIFTSLLVYNRFQFRLSPIINWVDVMVWISFIVGVIPLMFSFLDIILEDPPSWVSRFETEEFFSSSALLLLSLSLAIHQFEVKIKVRFRHIIYLLTALTIVSGVLYLFTDQENLWTSTLVLYNIEGLFAGFTLSKFTDEKFIRYLSIMLLIAFILAFAIFVNEFLFLAGVGLYITSISILEYLMIRQYEFN